MTLLFRPTGADLRIIGYYTGRVLIGLSLFLAVPLAAALVLQRWNDASALVVALALTVATGGLAQWRLSTDEDLEWSHGMVTVAVSWLLGALLYAVPLYLSGHFGSPLDALFDAMSGLTTSGLALIQDLDHLSVPMNLLRHLSHFAGGQGIVIVALSALGSSSAQVGTLYVGEGRDERVVPNIVRTARFIFLVAFTFLVIGTAGLWLAGLGAGLGPGRSLFHAFNLFMAAFDTGGFSPYSTSVAYYHSAAMEGVLAVLMIGGALSFGLHFALWRGRLRALRENLEIRALAVTTFGLALLTLWGLGRAGTFGDAVPLLRRGFFTVLSAHTGTGFTVTAGRLYATDWGVIAPAGLVIAMALGGMASSTTGGFKAMRIALAAKAVLHDIRRALAPDSALVVTTYTRRYRRVVDDEQFRGAIAILLLFLLTYLAGAMVGVFHGIPFQEAMFESTSAAANVGLSIGVLDPTNPVALKVTYLVQMWVGRLEFMAVFALVGYLLAGLRARV